MDASRLKEFRAALPAQQAELQAAEAASAGDRAAVELDQQAVGRLSRMDALQVQTMVLETSRRRSVDLRRIAAALARMDEGEYGYCLECSDEIAGRQLDLDPAAPLCIRCASGG